MSVYLIDGARTAFTSFGGALANVKADDLGAVTAVEAMKKSKVNPLDIDHVIYGNVIHSSTNASFLSRHIALKAGIPIEVPAFNVNRLCGSGSQSIVSAAQLILLNEADIVLAGGAENMSMAPYVNFTSRFGSNKLGLVSFEDMVLSTLNDEYADIRMGMTAEKLADQYSITREEQDHYALLSQQRAGKARDEGILSKEIVAVKVPQKKGTTIVLEDEHIRSDLTAEKLAGLKPSFIKDGTVTAGNSSGINDGAASIIVASKKAVEEHGLTPLAKIVSWAVTGVDPTIMGIGPVPAIKKALLKAALGLEDMDLVEINEAFATQYLSVEKELNLDRSKTNVNGGAIALGHPVGASGTRILLTLAYSLKDRGLKYGVASLCIGGGQGIAVIIESL